MNIPDNVKIGGYLYDVIRPSEPFTSNQVVADGEHDFTRQTIKVACTGSESYQNTVFIHEICNGIIKYYCDESNLIDEEKFVEQFAKRLYQVIADNPDIFKKNSERIPTHEHKPILRNTAQRLQRQVVHNRQLHHC